MSLSIEFREQCETIAMEWRVSLGLYAYDPLPADRLAFELKAEVRGIHQDDTLPQDAVDYFMRNGRFWAGTLVRDPLVILYNPRQSPERYESSIMEELAHVLLNHPPELLVPCDNRGRGNHRSQIEQEAKFLASCLKIPRRGLLWAVQKKLVDKQIAKHFGTSIQMVQWRRNMNKSYL